GRLGLERLQLGLELRVLGAYRRHAHAAPDIDEGEHRQHQDRTEDQKSAFGAPSGLLLDLVDGEQVYADHVLSPTRRAASPTVTASDAAFCRTNSASTARPSETRASGLAISTGVSRRSR